MNVRRQQFSRPRIRWPCPAPVAGFFSAAPELVDRPVVVAIGKRHVFEAAAAAVLHTLAAALMLDARYAEAERLLRRNARLPLRQDSSLVATYVSNSLGEVLCFRGQDREAEAVLRRALATHASIVDQRTEEIFEYRLVPGESKLKLLLVPDREDETAEGNLRVAQDLFDRSLRIMEVSLGADHANLIRILAGQAELLWATNEKRRRPKSDGRTCKAGKALRVSCRGRIYKGSGSGTDLLSH